MNISVFHYHLNPGGVTRIIESQVAAFRQNFPDYNIQVISGHCENPEYYSNLDVKLITNSILNYLENKPYSSAELNIIFNNIYTFVKQQISSSEVLHVHNLNLGKNPVLTLVFNKLLGEGYKIINHAHDFAEDRPTNMAFLEEVIGKGFKQNVPDVLYPNNKNYIIGVLNQFDFNRVISYNILESRVFLWANPVFVELKTEKSKTDLRNDLLEIFNIAEHYNIITYPVRVIQRKNIGELILLAYLFKNTCRFLVTLPPRNPVEITFYNKWVAFCKNNDIPVVFEAGIKADFETIVCGSDYCITTSIKEGFGMSYLEPWLMGTPVIGRDINSVTGDIIDKGVKFPLLYNEIMVNNNNNYIDFKNLSLEDQQLFIIRLIEEDKANQVIEDNNFLKQFPPQINDKIIVENQKTISEEFSLNKYAERIFRAYQTIS